MTRMRGIGFGKPGQDRPDALDPFALGGTSMAAATLPTADRLTFHTPTGPGCSSPGESSEAVNSGVEPAINGTGGRRVGVADRLTFEWSPSFRPDYRLDVTVTETKPRSERTTRYMLDEIDALDVGRVFLVAKDAEGGEVYEVFVGPGVHCCTCPGSQCRKHGLRCRHILAVQHCISEGAI